MRIFRSIIGMEVLGGGNWFRLYMASVFGVTSFQLSLLRNYVFKLFSNCLQQVLSFQAFGPNFWLKAKINGYGSNILIPLALQLLLVFQSPTGTCWRGWFR